MLSTEYWKYISEYIYIFNAIDLKSVDSGIESMADSELGELESSSFSI